MKNVKTYEQFINETFKSSKIDAKTQMFCEGRISDDEYYEYLNEGIIDDIKNWVSDVAFYTFDWFQKLGDVLLTLLKNVAKFAINVGEKIIQAIKWIYNKIKTWAEKHPVAFKVIVIVVTIFIILIICCACAQAQARGQEVPHPLIDAAIGTLRQFKDSVTDNQVRMKAIAWLVDMKNGTTKDASVYGPQAINLAKSSMEVCMKAAKPESGISPEFLQNLVEQGSQITKATIEQGSGASRVILGN